MFRTIFFQHRIATTQFFSVALVALILFSKSYWEQMILSGILFLLGAVLVGVATVGRLWCSLYISGYKNNTLIMAGPYSVCRNPLYFFSLLGSIGIGLATGMLIVPLIIVCLFALYYPYIIREEEKNLMHLHGSVFKKYCATTPKFLPAFTQILEPENYEVKPRIFRKRLFDSLWFVWILGILQLLVAFQEHQLIPVFFELY